MPHHTILVVLYTAMKLALKTETMKYLAFAQIPRKQTYYLLIKDSAECGMMFNVVQMNSWKNVLKTIRTFELTVGSSMCTNTQGTSKIVLPALLLYIIKQNAMSQAETTESTTDCTWSSHGLVFELCYNVCSQMKKKKKTWPLG